MRRSPDIDSAGATLSIAAGETLALSGKSSFAGTVSGDGTLAFSGGSQGINSGAMLTVSNWTVSGSDAVTLKENLTYGGALSIGAGTTMTIDAGDTLTLTDAASFAGSLQGLGNITLAGATLSGSGSVAVGIVDDGQLVATTGTLDLSKAISGTGTMTIDANATLHLSSSAAATLEVNFDGTGATLALSAVSNFAASIGDFTSGDTIDLTNKTATQATLGANDQLVIKNGSHAIATLQLTGNYAGYTFNVGSDGHGGTDITATPPAPIDFDFSQSGQTFVSTGQAASISILNGTASDTFDFNGQFGAITITGYTPGGNALNFDHNDFSNIAAVEAHATQDAQGNTIISLDATDSIVLVGVTLSQFESHTADWHFI